MGVQTSASAQWDHYCHPECIAEFRGHLADARARAEGTEQPVAPLAPQHAAVAATASASASTMGSAPPVAPPVAPPPPPPPPPPPETVAAAAVPSVPGAAPWRSSSALRNRLGAAVGAASAAVRATVAGVGAGLVSVSTVGAGASSSSSSNRGGDDDAQPVHGGGGGDDESDDEEQPVHGSGGNGGGGNGGGDDESDDDERQPSHGSWASPRRMKVLITGAAREVTKKMPRISRNGGLSTSSNSVGTQGTRSFASAAAAWLKSTPPGLMEKAEVRALRCKGQGDWTEETMEEARDCFLIADFTFKLRYFEATHNIFLHQHERYQKKDEEGRVTGVVHTCAHCNTNTYLDTPGSGGGGYNFQDSAENQRTCHGTRVSHGFIGLKSRCYNPACPGVKDAMAKQERKGVVFPANITADELKRMNVSAKNTSWSEEMKASMPANVRRSYKVCRHVPTRPAWPSQRNARNMVHGLV